MDAPNNLPKADTKAWLRPLVRPLRPAFREVAAQSLFINVLALGLPVFVLQVYDRVVYYKGFSTLYGLVAGISIVIVFDFILRQARSRILQRAAMLIDIRLGERLYDKLASLPLNVLESRPTSYWLTLFRDSELVRNVFSGPTAVLATELPFVGLFILLIFVIAAPIAWLLVIAVPFFLALAWGSGKVMEKATEKERESGQSREALVAEILAGRTTVKALAVAPSFRPKWEDRHASAIRQSLERGRKGDSFTNVGVSFALIVSVVMTTFGAVEIVNQELTIGALIAANMLSNRIIQPLNQLVNTWRQFAQYRQAAQRLAGVFQLPSERTEIVVDLTRPRGEIALENVTFAYKSGGRPVVDGLRMTIKPGGMVGLIGPNGCGKTTLIKLIEGLYPLNAGRILLDGADINQFTRGQLARWIGYVPQENTLFSGTIRDNIAVGDLNSPDEKVVAAARLAGVHAFVVDLPDGYATDIGEAGSRISGGERQRIAVARALLHDPPVLLLDEVASNLDRQAELALRDSLVKLAANRTILVACHTPALLAACTHIVVMDKGKIALAGPTREIMPKLFGQTRPEALQEAKA
ncbi:MAG: ATP-binding cassette domain-containing protein [Alphaproteobacteria bacterium]|nr:ATP-binding cassette domain-containing protein [Alphaproteobacteria bacterium]